MFSLLFVSACVFSVAAFVALVFVLFPACRVKNRRVRCHSCGLMVPPSSMRDAFECLVCWWNRPPWERPRVDWDSPQEIPRPGKPRKSALQTFAITAETVRDSGPACPVESARRLKAIKAELEREALGYTLQIAGEVARESEKANDFGCSICCGRFGFLSMSGVPGVCLECFRTAEADTIILHAEENVRPVAVEPLDITWQTTQATRRRMNPVGGTECLPENEGGRP